MPFIDITTTPSQQLPGEPILRLTPTLPGDFMKHKHLLRLNPGTPKGAVRVCLFTFGQHDVNVPEIGFFIRFTEELTEEERIAVRDHFERLILVPWLKEEFPPLLPWPDIDVDLFWTNGAAGLMIRGGEVFHRWPTDPKEG